MQPQRYLSSQQRLQLLLQPSSQPPSQFPKQPQSCPTRQEPALHDGRPAIQPSRHIKTEALYKAPFSPPSRPYKSSPSWQPIRAISMEPRSQSSSQPPLLPSPCPSSQTPTHSPPGKSSLPSSQPPTQPLSKSYLQPTSQASLELSSQTSSQPLSPLQQFNKQPPRGTSTLAGPAFSRPGVPFDAANCRWLHP